MSSSVFDLVIFGSTGVTGRQVVRQIHSRANDLGLKWAVAGRHPDRIKARLAEIDISATVLPVDVGDAEAVAAVVDHSTAIANLVGPYARHGAAIYTACALSGTHQVDVCGEIDWLADIPANVHALAQESGAKIVHTAGFESLPFDLMTLLAATNLASVRAEALAEIDVAISVLRDPPIVRPTDLISGGTFLSGTDALRRGPHRANRDSRVLDRRGHVEVPFDLTSRLHQGTGQWIGPLLPSPYINPAIAQKTASLLRDQQPGLFADRYLYREGLVAEGLLPGLPPALGARWLSSAQQGNALLTSSPTAWRTLVADLAERIGPSSGDGPDEDHLEGWAWRLDGRATSTGGHHLDVVVRGQGHPGYRSTGNLVAEAALLLAGDGASGPGGLLTPASAFGVDSIAAFERAGMTIEIA